MQMSWTQGAIVVMLLYLMWAGQIHSCLVDRRQLDTLLRIEDALRTR